MVGGHPAVPFIAMSHVLHFLDPKMVKPLCEMLTEMQSKGSRTPQITFLTNSKHERVVSQLYSDYYDKNLYEQHWFRWGEANRPLLMAAACSRPL